MTILGIKGTSTEATDPATAFELLLCSLLQAVTHKKELYVIMVTLRLTESAVYVIISDGLHFCLWVSLEFDELWNKTDMQSKRTQTTI